MPFYPGKVGKNQKSTSKAFSSLLLFYLNQVEMCVGEKKGALIFLWRGKKIQVKRLFKLIHLLDHLNLSLMKGHQRRPQDPVVGILSRATWSWVVKHWLRINVCMCVRFFSFFFPFLKLQRLSLLYFILELKGQRTDISKLASPSLKADTVINWSLIAPVRLSFPLNQLI